jgi:hypothetical protein
MDESGHDRGSISGNELGNGISPVDMTVKAWE